ncbi:MAG: hypothetical protein IH614_14365 [Desulfuromonadales bacterium]|nr:hypothetical protein [Desulfuromonadales bacterium]
MCKKWFLPLLFLCLPSFSPAAGESFRNCDWGNSEAQIREKESSSLIAESPLQEGVKILVFGDDLAGLPTFVVYVLAKDRLVNAKYAFAEEHDNANLYLADFAKVGALLQETHGEPVEAGAIWQNGAGEEEIEWTLSIAIGELILLGRWQTEESEIVHLLRGEEMKIYHEVEYLRREAGEIEVKVKPEPAAKTTTKTAPPDNPPPQSRR